MRQFPLVGRNNCLTIAPMRLLSPTSSVILLFACASVAHADLVITAPDVVVAPNSTGNFFDIELDYPTPDEGAFEIASLSVDLHLQPFDSDLTITNVTEATDSPYLFSPFDSGVGTFGLGFNSQTIANLLSLETFWCLLHRLLLSILVIVSD